MLDSQPAEAQNNAEQLVSPRPILDEIDKQWVSQKWELKRELFCPKGNIFGKSVVQSIIFRFEISFLIKILICR